MRFRTSVRCHRTLTRSICFVVLAGMLAGCSKPAPSVPPVPPQVPAPPTQPAKDERTRWVYESGWFVQGIGKAWFEHNDEANRIHGGPWEFIEKKRTPEFVELYDARRGVSIRLTEQACEARWDKDGSDAEWQSLYKGKWEKRD